MRRLTTLTVFLFLFLSVNAAEVLVVVEKRDVTRWKTASPEWTRVGTFLDSAASGFRPLSVAAAGDRAYVACESEGPRWSIELAYFEGKIYVTSTWGWVYAYDAATGERTEPVATLYGANGVAATEFPADAGLIFTLR